MSKNTWLAWILVWNLMCKYTEVSADTEGPKCDPPWEKLHRTCVQFMKAKPFLTWQKARDSCISMNADLLSVNDKEENGKLKPLVRRHVRSRDLLYWWIGIREVGHSWLWLDNDEQYANIPEWAAGPGRFHTGRCGLYSFRGTLENVECELEKPYICEQFKVTTDSTTLTTTGKATSASTDKQTPNPTRGSYTTIAISKEPLTDRITGLLCLKLRKHVSINRGIRDISWPRSEPGQQLTVLCDKGHAKWKCDKNPTCWRDKPDVKQCTSETIQVLTSQILFHLLTHTHIS